MQNKQEDAKLHKQNGDEHYKKQEYDKAVECYNKALKLKPDYKEVWLNKGLCLRQMKRKHDEAVAAFSKAIECDPQYAKAIYNLAEMLRSRKSQEAIMIIDNYIQQGGDSADILKLKKDIEFNSSTRTFVDNASPKEVTQMLGTMRDNVMQLSTLIQNVSGTIQQTLANQNNPENLDSVGRELENLGGQMLDVVGNAQQQLGATLIEAVKTNPVASDAKCYWMM